MGHSAKIAKKNAERILAQQGHKAQVKESFKVAKETVVEPVSRSIQADFDAINTAINSLDKKDKQYGQKKAKLQSLIGKVASKYAIEKQLLKDVQEEINVILGVNNSSTSNT